MRSSESANSASQAISVRIRWRLAKSGEMSAHHPPITTMLANAASQKAYSHPPQRARVARLWVTFSTSAGVCGLGSGFIAARLSAGRAGKQALRANDQEHDHDGINDE